MRTATGLAVMDLIRGGGHFTVADVVKGVKDGTISKKELGERAFGYLLDLYFSSKVPSMKAQLAHIGRMNPAVEELSKINPQEAEDAILAVTGKRKLPEQVLAQEKAQEKSKEAPTPTKEPEIPAIVPKETADALKDKMRALKAKIDTAAPEAKTAAKEELNGLVKRIEDVAKGKPIGETPGYLEEQFKQGKKSAETPPAMEPTQPPAPKEPWAETLLDADVEGQRLVGSIREGEMILNSKVDALGRKRSKESYVPIQKAVNNSKDKLGRIFETYPELKDKYGSILQPDLAPPAKGGEGVDLLNLNQAQEIYNRNVPEGKKYYLRWDDKEYKEGESLPPSRKYVDGELTGKTYKGTSVIDPSKISQLSEQDRERNYYPYDHLYMVEGKPTIKGSDPAEVFLKDAKVVKYLGRNKPEPAGVGRETKLYSFPGVDTTEAVQNLVKGVKGAGRAWGEVKESVAKPFRIEPRARQIIVEYMANNAGELARVENDFRPFKEYFKDFSPEDFLRFTAQAQHGDLEGLNPQEKAFAELHQKISDTLHEQVNAYKPLAYREFYLRQMYRNAKDEAVRGNVKAFYEGKEFKNYLDLNERGEPALYRAVFDKDGNFKIENTGQYGTADKAVPEELKIKGYRGKTLTGGRGYFKARTIPDYPTAMMLGLEPYSYNPAEIALRDFGEKLKFIYGMQAWNTAHDEEALEILHGAGAPGRLGKDQRPHGPGSNCGPWQRRRHPTGLGTVCLRPGAGSQGLQ